jgi:putative membrane protein
MLAPIIQKNDKQAKLLIGIFSVVVLVAVTFLSKFTLVVELPFDKHIFALVNALLNATVAILLVAALVAVKQQKSLNHIFLITLLIYLHLLSLHRILLVELILVM